MAGDRQVDRFFGGIGEKGLARARIDSSRNVCTHKFKHDRVHAITIARMQVRKHSSAHASTPAAPRCLSHASTPAVAKQHYLAVGIFTCTIPNTSSPTTKQLTCSPQAMRISRLQSTSEPSQSSSVITFSSMNLMCNSSHSAATSDGIMEP